MKIKSHKLSWAMSLCAVAVFSLTAGRAARAEAVSFSGSGSDSSAEPVTMTDRSTPPPGTEPVTPPPPSTDNNEPVQSGSFSGTIMAD
ncbi:MAG TPA: hypothetical protein VF626_01490 [Chthoniobacterales bacterium]|jgi:hypothetical protein